MITIDINRLPVTNGMQLLFTSMVITVTELFSNLSNTEISTLPTLCIMEKTLM